MKNQLKLVSDWVKHNRSMTIIYAIILGMIACLSGVLMLLLSVKDTYSQDGKYYYCYYLDNSIGNDVADKILFDLCELGIEPLEYEVAAHVPGYHTGNKYTFGAYYVMDYKEQKLRDDNYDGGVFENEKGTYISDRKSSPLKLEKGEFQSKGKGAIVIGSCGCDYLIAGEDYKEYVDKIDAIEVTLTKKSSQVDDVINAYTKQYKEEKSISVLKSGWEGIKNTVLVSVVLVLISLYSACLIMLGILTI